MSVVGQDGGSPSGQMRDFVQKFASNVLAHHKADRFEFSSDLEAWRDLAKESSELLEVPRPSSFSCHGAVTTGSLHHIWRCGA